jgi:hypothetical protein
MVGALDSARKIFGMSTNLCPVPTFTSLSWTLTHLGGTPLPHHSPAKRIEAQADSLIHSLADADTAISNLRLEYLPKFKQALPGGTKAELFFQLDRRLDYLMNVQMASQLPVIKP